MQEKKNEKGLEKVLGRWDSVAIILAIVIGVGIFRIPAEVARYLASPGFIISAWITGGLISLIGALCYAELSSTFPQTGGSYIYLKKSYGPLASFLFGWSELLVIRTGSIAAVAFILAEYLGSFLALDAHFVKPIAIFSIGILAFINIVGLKYGKRTQDIFVIVKIGALVGLIILGFMSGKGNFTHFHHTLSHSAKGFFPLFGLALIPILWTYGGWHENVFVAGETRDAERTVPFALITGVLIVTLLYVLANLLYIYILPLAEIRGNELIAARILDVLYGKCGKKTFEAIIIISSIAGINAMIITGSRITYAMAQDNPIFGYMKKLSCKFGTPRRAIIIIAIWSMVLVLWGTFNRLLFFTGILVWFFFALVVTGLFILRRKFPDIKRHYTTWGYPVTPLIFILVSIALVLNTLISYPYQSLIGLGLLAIGIPVYFISRRLQ
ncbi:MAG: amino acid permease [Candidatus Omnitrophica bacterium]|nr:amino acid permease [Candidatus Omnitrophota bacterium]